MSYKSPNLTAGRTVFSCTPEQFDRFVAGVGNLFPRQADLEIASETLGFQRVLDDNGMYDIVDPDGNVWVAGSPSIRLALRRWWVTCGLDATQRVRDRDKAWEKLAVRGRPPLDGTPANVSAYNRQIIRQNHTTLLNGVWDAVADVLCQHYPGAELWWQQTDEPKLQRYPHPPMRAGNLKIRAHALRHLFDLDELSPSITAMFEGTSNLEDVQNSGGEELFDRIARRVDVAGMIARMALYNALSHGSQPELLFSELHQAMIDGGFEDRTEFFTFLEKIT